MEQDTEKSADATRFEAGDDASQSNEELGAFQAEREALAADLAQAKATTIASSSIVRTVECGSFGPVRPSETEERFFHLVTVF